MTNYKLSYPAVNGDVVTEGHANYCKANGHATHVVDGVESSLCPRCGDNKNEIPTVSDTESSYQVMVYYSDGTNKLAHDPALSYGKKEVKEIRKSIRNFKRRGEGYGYVLRIEEIEVDPYNLPNS